MTDRDDEDPSIELAGAQGGKPAFGSPEARRKAAESPRLDPIEKAMRNPTSLRLAINAKCYDCEGRDADPNVRQRIGDCRVPKCPLYPVRPYQHLAPDAQ
jgi:hypothetical protein